MTTCPYCGRENDTHAPTGNDYEVPSDGDVSVCWKCHRFGIFTADGSVRATTPEEDADLHASPQMQDVLNVLTKAAVGPTKAADILRHAEAWEAGHLQTETGTDA